MFPGVSTPLPPAKTAVRAELEPASIVVGLAAKLVIVGVGTTVTVTVCVATKPALLFPVLPVTVSV
jgi:hypothetical protein